MSIEQHAEAAKAEMAATYLREALSGKVLRPIQVREQETVPIIAKHIQAAIDEATATSDYAQVGALLAKCEAVHLFKHAQTGEWIARVDVGDDHRTKTGTTRLAAIRAAVEAAEKGVRE